MTTKTRITVPEGKVALLLDKSLASELQALCLIIRRAGKSLRFDFADAAAGNSGAKAVAGDVLLALLEAQS